MNSFMLWLCIFLLILAFIDRDLAIGVVVVAVIAMIVVGPETVGSSLEALARSFHNISKSINDPSYHTPTPPPKVEQ